MIIEYEPKITKDYLLERASQETYLEYYLGIPVKKGLYKSPLRKDDKPTCSFYRNRSGDIIFKDFSGQFSGNFISVVMYKYSCSYYMALKIIANDFGYIKHKKLTRNTKPIVISNNTFKDDKGAKIQIEAKDFSLKELLWWKQYGITEKILKKFRVFSCKTVFLNDKIFTKSNLARPIFGYYRGKNSDDLELWRIYLPFHRSNEPRFLSNWKSSMIQGIKQLPKEGDVLIITKSLKDVMCLYALGYNAIAPNSENIFLTENQYKKLKEKFKNIVLFYDNDLAGISNMNKIRKKYDIKCLWIPRHYKCKDISDFYKEYGEIETKKLLEYAEERIKYSM